MPIPTPPAAHILPHHPLWLLVTSSYLKLPGNIPYISLVSPPLLHALSLPSEQLPLPPGSLF